MRIKLIWTIPTQKIQKEEGRNNFIHNKLVDETYILFNCCLEIGNICEKAFRYFTGFQILHSLQVLLHLLFIKINILLIKVKKATDWCIVFNNSSSVGLYVQSLFDRFFHFHPSELKINLLAAPTRVKMSNLLYIALSAMKLSRQLTTWNTLKTFTMYELYNLYQKSFSKLFSVPGWLFKR